MRTRTTELSRFPTIREEARYGNTLSEHELRLMLKRGELPGFYYGERKKYFRINHEQLIEKLNLRSSANIESDPLLI